MNEQELIVIPQHSAMQVFTTEGAMDPYLARIRQEIDAFDADVSTTKGRKDIASMAFRVAKAKTYLDGVGKALADEVKSIPKKIDASRKHIRDTLDQWRDEVRQPLTDWEDAEERRTKAHTDAIAHIGYLARPTDEGGNQHGAAALRANLVEVEAVVIGPQCEEFATEYAIAKDQAAAALRRAIEAREKYEAEQAELEALRKAKAEREAKERDEAIRREAAERSRREAEERAQREAAEAARAAEMERQRVEREKADAIARAERAEAERIAAEARAEREKQEAVEAERRRVAAEKAREEAETAKREANKRHRAKINGEALAGLTALGLTEDQGKAVVTAVATGKVPHITISY